MKLKLYTFRKGQHIPAELLKSYHKNKLVDVGAKTGCRGKVLVFPSGGVLFMATKQRKREVIVHIKDYAGHGHVEVLQFARSAKQVRKDYGQFKNRAKCPNISEYKHDAS